MDDSFVVRTKKFIKKAKANPMAKRVFIQGDSWFTLPGGHYKGSSVAELLNNDTWVRAQQQGKTITIAALSVSRVGMTIQAMASDLKMKQALARVEDAGLPWDAICLSGGGNDLLDKVKQLIDGNGTLVASELKTRLAIISSSWDSLEALFGDRGMAVPVVTHGYGHVTPTLTSSTMLMGVWKKEPWVGPYLLGTLKLSPSDAKVLTDTAIDGLNKMLAQRAKKNPKLTALDLRHLVNTWQPGDWHDEIHPFAPGFEAIAKRVLEALFAKWS